MHPRFPPSCAEAGHETRLKQLPRVRFLVGQQPQLLLHNPSTASVMRTASSKTPSDSSPAHQDSSDTETDDDGHLIQRAIRQRDEMLKRQAQGKQVPAKRRRISQTRTPGVSIKTLIDENLISPGPDVLSLEYCGRTETASIEADGKIEWKGLRFESPSSFSIHVKRLVNPSRKADDGWKTVKHCGRFLEYYKMELAKRRCRQRDCPAPSNPRKADITIGVEADCADAQFIDGTSTASSVPTQL